MIFLAVAVLLTLVVAVGALSGWRPSRLLVLLEPLAWLVGRLFPQSRRDAPEPDPGSTDGEPLPEQQLYYASSPSRSARTGSLSTDPPRPSAPIGKPAGGGGDGTAPLVRRFVVADGANGGKLGREIEPRLPARVVVGCAWHDSFFRGWCGIGSGARPTVRLSVRAAALRGATHASNGTEGQDAIGAAWDERRHALYLAVADGLGSLRRSGPVAAQAINAALQLCTTRPDNLTFADSGARLYGAIAGGLRRTFENSEEPLDGACTLVVAEVVPRFDGANVTVHGVGDSEAWVLFDGGWNALHHERRPYDNATRELPTHAAPETVRYEVPPGSVLLLGSDGFAGALDTSVSPLARGLSEYWRQAPSWLDFINHVGFVDDYWSDDRSAVAVWIGDGGANG